VANFGERYELIRRIGAGGMGEVWLAHDEQLDGRPVAIKIMHKHMLPNPGDVARFEREARIAASMSHPNIVTVYTTGTGQGAPFMVMEYLSGQDLEKAQPRGDAERVAAIGRDICSALAYAHGKGVIHRDIKPGNLFLCDTGQVKVTDFGIARAANGTTLSVAGVLVGTFAYLSPEQWRGAAPAFSNDVWAAGCVLYRLLSGRPPRVFPDAAGYAAAAMRGDPVADLRDVSDAPDWLASTVMAMLDLDPARRPAAADCVQLLAGLPSMTPASQRPSSGSASLGQASLGLPYLGQPFPGHPGAGWAEPRLAGAAGPSPDTAAMTRPVAVGTAGHRPRRRGRVVTAIAGVVALVVAGSLIALRFHGSPQSSGTAAGGTSAPPATAPATSRPGTATASAPARPAGATSPSRAATPTTRKTASTAPKLVPVPHVVGMTFTRARLILIGDGFRVVGRHVRPGQTVTSTSPSGKAPAGSVITVVYGTGL
jgi:serine/threonine-protein kinase